MSKVGQNRKCLSLREKADVLNDLDGMSMRETAAKWDISLGQVSAIKKNKEKILQDAKEGGKRKRSRAGPQEDIGKALYIWFIEKVAQGGAYQVPFCRKRQGSWPRRKVQTLKPLWLLRDG